MGNEYHPKITNIWEYAVGNGFAKDMDDIKKACKNECEVGIHILEKLSNMDRIEHFKIYPLYNIGSKSHEILGDRLFWIMLTTLTV